MTEITYFAHLFGGWKSAEAYRYRNPDGSEGGIVAKSAIVAEGGRAILRTERALAEIYGRDAA